jgi:hypothetical protein
MDSAHNAEKKLSESKENAAQKVESKKEEVKKLATE